MKNLSDGIIQGGIATAMTPFVSGLVPAQFQQVEKHVEAEQETINPTMQGVMW